MKGWGERGGRNVIRAPFKFHPDNIVLVETSNVQECDDHTLLLHPRDCSRERLFPVAFWETKMEPLWSKKQQEGKINWCDKKVGGDGETTSSGTETTNVRAADSRQRQMFRFMFFCAFDHKNDRRAKKKKHGKFLLGWLLSLFNQWGVKAAADDVKSFRLKLKKITDYWF